MSGRGRGGVVSSKGGGAVNTRGGGNASNRGGGVVTSRGGGVVSNRGGGNAISLGVNVGGQSSRIENNRDLPNKINDIGGVEDGKIERARDRSRTQTVRGLATSALNTPSELTK
jgi:hypothetical protein